MSLVIQLAEVAAKACCRGKKTTEGERDPALAGSAAVCRQHRKEERKRKALGNEGMDEVEEKEGAIARKTKRWLDICPRAPGGLEETPILGLLIRASCTGLPLLGEPEVTHSFGISYVRALGGFLGWLSGKEESGSREVKHDYFQLPGGGHAVAWFAWNSLQRSDGTRRENN